MIHKKIGVPADEQKLKLSGGLLKDGRTLSAYNIQDGDTVTMNYSTGKVAVQVLLITVSWPSLIIFYIMN